MKDLLAGAGIAAVAGLLMGAAAKPDLGWDDRPAGPQIVAAGGGGRSTGPFDDGAAFANYKGQLPDYVLGSDWKKSLTLPVLTADASPAAPADLRASREAPANLSPSSPVTRASYEEPPHPAPVYPSMQGGEPHGADILPPAHPDSADTPTG